MEKFNSIMVRLENYIGTEKFEKKSEKVTWWVIGISSSYFIIRTILSIVWDI